jgi:hypothetical protein
MPSVIGDKPGVHAAAGHASMAALSQRGESGREREPFSARAHVDRKTAHCAWTDLLRDRGLSALIKAISMSPATPHKFLDASLRGFSETRVRRFAAV